MRHLLFFTCLFFAGNFFSQTILTIEDSNKKFDKDSLQEHYFFEIMSADITDCFDVSGEVFIDEWEKFTRGLAKYLKDKNFLFGLRTKANLEVYFNKEGKIDLFFYAFRDANFPPEFHEKFIKHISEFAKEYKFTIVAKQAFSNSGSITFMH